MLLDFGIIPYLVFDGDSLPSKGETNAERRKKREEAKAAGLQLLRAGKTTQAYQELQKATTVTTSMAKELIEAIKRMNVQYVVAPYEADAQLVYLERKGIIDGILSEDSDMLVYGAKRLVTKLNQYAECVEIERSDFTLCKEISLTGWTDAMFRRMAILSGCDYLPNIDKMGLKTAYRYVRKYKDAERVIQVLRFENKLSVPSDYLERFRDAEVTFVHHRVFCPIRREMVFMQELLPGMKESEMPYLGNHVVADVVIGVACGDLDPKTKKPFPPKSAPRPGLRDARRQTAPNQSLKPSRSIESFLVKRQPLAELDPNSLTPSPSQQRLLEQHRNSSWEPRLTSSAPQLRPFAPTNSLPRQTRTDRSLFLARASTVSTFQTSKRPRLCSDSQDSPPSQAVKQSPFFANSKLQASPSVLKVARNKKPRQSRFDIWSDDSLDDALLGLPNVQEAVSPEKCGNEQRECNHGEDHLSSIPQSSPPPQANDGITLVKASEATQTIDSESQVVDPEPFEDILESHIKVQRELKTFAYQSASQREDALRTLSPSKPASSQSRLFSGQSPVDQRAALATLPSTGAIGDLCNAISRKDPSSSKDTLIVLASPRPTSTATNETTGLAALSPVGRGQSPIQLPAILDDEEGLIPNSEDEGEEYDDEIPTTLNLRAFAYVGS